MKFDESCAIIGVVGGLASKVLGGFDYTLKALLMLMVIDFLCGLICAAVFNTSQYSQNGLTSDAMIKGAVRKISVIFIVAIAVVIDRILNFDYVRNGAVMYFIATEGISVLEHLVTMGVPVPSVVTSMLENIKKDSNMDKAEQEQMEVHGKREAPAYEGKRVQKD